MLAGCGAGASPGADAGPAAVGPERQQPPAATAVHAAPRFVRIPAIGVAAKVGGLALNADETVEVPSRPAETGWYRFGPAPGQPGSAVILGHVDSTSGPAVFARLKQLRPGNQVAVTMSDRSVVDFVVDEVSTYPIAKFPAKRVYGGRGASTLNLVTCGGRYDQRLGYMANVVVYTSAVKPPAPGARGAV